MQPLLHNFATSEVTAMATMLPARVLPNQLLIADSFCDCLWLTVGANYGKLPSLDRSDPDKVVKV